MVTELAAAGRETAAESRRVRTKIDRKSLLAKALKVLEFAWGTGILDLNCEEYGELMMALFPQAFGTKRDIQAAIDQLRNRKARLFPVA